MKFFAMKRCSYNGRRQHKDDDAHAICVGPATVASSNKRSKNSREKVRNIYFFSQHKPQKDVQFILFMNLI